MTQPAYAPVPFGGEVRPTKPTANPELGRAPKAGLLKHVAHSALAGTPSPNEGYALTLAQHACDEVELPTGVDRHDVTMGIALLAAKRASAFRRGPTMLDVRRAMEVVQVTSTATAKSLAAFAGLHHSYAAQRLFVDSVNIADLL